MLNVNLDQFESWEEFMPIVRALDPGGDYIGKAVGSTNQRMAQWMLTRSVRGLSARLGIPQKVLRRRLKRFRVQGYIHGAKVWYGLDAIPFTDLRPVEDRGGVVTRDGGYYERGAFVTASRKTGRMRVLKRQGRERLPVEDVEANIYQQAMDFIADHIMGTPEFEAQYMRVLERELKWRTRTI
ncbi:hypothetical protein AAC691_15550 [Nguyenibacter vanlangensis]|uniref:Uncharacterized protein n=1 Tax=Nguyenibacter vanlangensis TaxID=1216886 RepID=A0ABZ3D1R5_9PROT